MLILGIAIVNVALPSMQRALGLSAENIQWVVGGYALTFGGFLMLGAGAVVAGHHQTFVIAAAISFVAAIVALSVIRPPPALPVAAPGAAMVRPALTAKRRTADSVLTAVCVRSALI